MPKASASSSKVKYGNTTQVTLNVSGLGPKPVIHCDGSQLLGYELLIGQLIDVAYDGVNFEAIGGVNNGGTVVLNQPRDFYVNGTTGSDTVYDGTAATVSGVQGPFQTIEKALATMQKYNLGGFYITIHIADGTYATTAEHGIVMPLPNGSGTVQLIGNTTDPRQVSIVNTASGSALLCNSGGDYNLMGLSLGATNYSPVDLGNGIWVGGSSNVVISNCNFNSVPSSTGGAHIFCAGGFVGIYGPTTISGSGGAHWEVGNGGTIVTQGAPLPTLSVLAPVSFQWFVKATTGGALNLGYASITGAGNVTGSKYNAIGNGVIDSRGLGVSYLPGSAAGTTASGGQYL